jgi:4-amino-4-deoxy-L-arabinose transferase-like glycosyltransferase
VNTFSLKFHPNGPPVRLATILSLLRWSAIAWIVVFWRLGYTGLLDPDEAHYAELTREMLRSHSWFVPLLDGVPFIDKPVLFHWLQVVSITVLGQSELANRMPSALAALALIGVTWWMATELFDRKVAQLAALMFATFPATFALASVGIFDMVFALFLFGGLSCLLVAALRGRERLQYVGYVLITLAVMTKGPVALVLVILLFLSACCAGRTAREAIRRLDWRIGLALILLAASPWFLWMASQFGRRFVRDYVLAGNVWYFTSPEQFSTRRSDPVFYLRTLIGAFFPWSLVMLGGAIDRVARWKTRKPSTEETYLWLWIVTVIGFFSLARFKLDTYIFPAAPACAVLAAVAWNRASQDVSERWTCFAVILIAGVLIVGGGISAIAFSQINLGIGAGAVVLSAALIVGGAALLTQLIRGRWSLPIWPTAPIVALLGAYVAVVLLGFPLLDRARPTRPIGRWIARHTEEGTPVGIYRLDKWRASVRYYSERPLLPLADDAGVEGFLSVPSTRYVVMLRSDFRDMQRAGVDVEEVAARPAIVGGSGKYFRRQIWGRLVVVTRRDRAAALSLDDRDIQ